MVYIHIYIYIHIIHLLDVHDLVCQSCRNSPKVRSRCLPGGSQWARNSLLWLFLGRENWWAHYVSPFCHFDVIWCLIFPYFSTKYALICYFATAKPLYSTLFHKTSFTWGLKQIVLRDVTQRLQLFLFTSEHDVLANTVLPLGRSFSAPRHACHVHVPRPLPPKSAMSASTPDLETADGPRVAMKTWVY